jgi:hypothetical protein
MWELYWATSDMYLEGLQLESRAKYLRSLTSVSTISSSISLETSRDTISNKPRPLPSNYLQIYYSSIILSLDVVWVSDCSVNRTHTQTHTYLRHTVTCVPLYNNKENHNKEKSIFATSMTLSCQWNFYVDLNKGIAKANNGGMRPRKRTQTRACAKTPKQKRVFTYIETHRKVAIVTKQRFCVVFTLLVGTGLAQSAYRRV